MPGLEIMIMKKKNAARRLTTFAMAEEKRDSHLAQTRASTILRK
jgi:hypothetical protein